MPSYVSTHQSRFWAGLTLPGVAHSASAFCGQVSLVGAMACGLFLLPAAAAQNMPHLTAAEPGAVAAEIVQVPTKLANFRQEASTPESQRLADWVMHSADNGKLPFMIVDKVNARVFVFDAHGQLTGASSALLGLAIGDDSVPGIGQRKLSSILPSERTTPSGRFVASLDRDINGHEVLWVDYDTSVSLHAVVKGTPKERRAERLASSSPLDKRISYGCITVK